MEMVQRTCESPKCAPDEDFISNMPEIVITNIMDRLPIQDAVRTSILSTNWRFKWTLLSQIVFDEKFFEKGAESRNKYNMRYVIRFLLHLKGPITRFDLTLPYNIIFDVEDIKDWFLFLEGMRIKKVTVLNRHKTPFTLPTHLFSCLELEHLILRNCVFHPPPSFRGFPNLLILELMMVRFESYKCGELITRCPVLNKLNIIGCFLSDKVKVAEIAKLKNLSLLCLSLSTLDITPFTTSSIFHFVGLFPKLQVLRLDFKMCKFLAEACAIKGIPTSFPCLNTLLLCAIDFGNDAMALSKNDVPPPAICSSALDRQTMGQLQLRNVMFESLRGSENEVCLIKSLLACSPLLEIMRVGLNSSSMVGGADGKFMFANKLIKLYRASPVVEIDLI